MRAVPFPLAFLLVLVPTFAVAQHPGASPAPPDTSIAVLTAPAGSATPRWSLAVPETLSFGAPLTLSLDFGAGPAAVPDSIGTAAPWLHVRPAGTDGKGNTLLELRCWRVGPWRLAWGSPVGAGEVLWTAAGLEPGAGALPVRDPRRPSRDLRPLAALVLGVAAAATAAWLLWRRRDPGLRPERADPPLRAWQTFAMELEPLVAEGGVPVGATKTVMERLGSVVRGYLGRRYAVRAAGLTGRDVAGSLRRRQYDPVRGRPLAAILAEVDRHRFAPTPPTTGLCRRLIADAVAAVAADREDTGTDGADAGDDVRARTAWRRLVETCRAWTDADRGARTGEGGDA